MNPPPVSYSITSLRATPPGANPIALSPFESQSLLANAMLGGQYGKQSRFVGFDDGSDLTTITMVDGQNVAHEASAVVTATTAMPKLTHDLNAERDAQGQGSWGEAKVQAVTVLTQGTGNTGPVYLTCLRAETPVKCGSGGTRMVYMGQVFSAQSSMGAAQSDLSQVVSLMEDDIFDPLYHYYVDPDGDIVLPSGIIMPRSNSPYHLCNERLGDRPEPSGLENPCDKAITNLLRCIWDAKCDATRALERARRSTVTTWVGGAAAFGGLILVCSGPLGWATLAAGGLAGLGTWGLYDGAETTIENCEDARAALDRIPSCWKTFAAESGGCQ